MTSEMVKACLNKLTRGSKLHYALSCWFDENRLMTDQLHRVEKYPANNLGRDNKDNDHWFDAPTSFETPLEADAPGENEVFFDAIDDIASLREASLPSSSEETGYRCNLSPEIIIAGG